MQSDSSIRNERTFLTEENLSTDAPETDSQSGSETEDRTDDEPTSLRVKDQNHASLRENICCRCNKVIKGDDIVGATCAECDGDIHRYPCLKNDNRCMRLPQSTSLRMKCSNSCQEKKSWNTWMEMWTRMRSWFAP